MWYNNQKEGASMEERVKMDKEQKELITRLIGLILIVYVALCMFAGNIGAILTVPFSFLFGGFTLFFYIALIGVGISLIILKKMMIRPKTYQYVCLSIALLFMLVFLSIDENIVLSNCFSKYFDVYSYKATLFSSDHPLLSLGGGLFGYFMTGLLNSITHQNIAIMILISSLCFAISVIILAFPLIVRLVKNAKRKEKKTQQVDNAKVSINQEQDDEDNALLETTSIELTGDNFESKRKIEHSPNKLRNLLDTYDDEIYDDYYKGKAKKETTKVIKEFAIPNKMDTVIIEDTKKPRNEIIEEKEEVIVNQEESEEPKEKKFTTVIDANYTLPPLFLLQDANDNGANYENEEHAKAQAHILLEKMYELNVNATINAFVVGPAVTRFEIALAPGVRVGSFVNLQEDFKLALGVNSIRIESPIPGKSAIGIEVPNKIRAMVSLKEIISSMPNKKEKLYVPVGKDITGNPLSFPICNMPHCLISGATNSGKSVCANSIILSLLMNYTPDEVKFIMVDPKRVEMSLYTDLPHLLCPIITESEKARVALDKLCQEMDNRFQTFAKNAVKNIAGYNNLMLQNNKDKMPFIILIVDEFAELMLCKNRSMVEEKIQKIAQLGRAAGIHLILATQRPDVNVIPGTIKSNLPCRMTFRLSSLVDSRTVIDVGGAEKLLNNGDMLLLTPDFTGLRRVQGTYVSDKEIEEVVEYCKKQRGTNYDENFLDLRSKDEIEEEEKLKYALEGNGGADEYDEIYEQVKKLVITEQKASTSFLQVRMKIGYARAARYVDMLEQDGIIGPANGSKPRDVLVSSVDNL